MVAAAFIWPHAKSQPPYAAPVLVAFVEFPEPSPSGPIAAPHVDADIPQTTAPPTPARMAAPVPVRDAIIAPEPNISDLLSDSQISGAASAGNARGGGDTGSGRGGCDTARILQQALQRDPLVLMAVENADRAGKAVVWGLAFAPEACRTVRMQGLVLLSLADGTTRFAIGADDWRWSDLLGLPDAASAR
jgi:hypothetical protein